MSANAEITLVWNRLAPARELHLRNLKSARPLERPIFIYKMKNIRCRQIHSLLLHQIDVLLHCHQSSRIPKWKGAQQYAFDDRKNQRACSNRKRQRKANDENKPGLFPELPDNMEDLAGQRRHRAFLYCKTISTRPTEENRARK
jgi:hypothetical protein